MINSKDIEDKYLSEVVSVSKILRLSTKIEMKFVHAQSRQIKLANAKVNIKSNGPIIDTSDFVDSMTYFFSNL